MREKKSNDDLVSLEMLFINLKEEEAKKLDLLVREIADKHGVEVQIEITEHAETD